MSLQNQTRNPSILNHMMVKLSGLALCLAMVPTARAQRPITIGVTAGSAGVGGNVSVPLKGNHLAARVGAGYFPVSGISFSDDHDGLEVNNVTAKFLSASGQLDLYPFKKNGLRVSPGVFYNGDKAQGDLAADGYFSLGGNNPYPSSTTPVTGTASLKFANTVAPGVTVGYARRGHTIGASIDFGVAYTGSPKFNAALEGRTCPTYNSPDSKCVDVATDTTTQANLTKRIANINNSLNVTHGFAPLLQVGVTYTIGLPKGKPSVHKMLSSLAHRM